MIIINKISQWTLTLSAVSILSGLLLAILPQDSHKKMFKVIVSVVLIYATLQPLRATKGIDFDISDYVKDNYQVSENMDKYALSAMVKSAEKAIEKVLSEKSESENLKVKFKCYCETDDEEIKVRHIYISPVTDVNDKITIENIIVSLGFEQSIIIYEGESNEHR